MSRGFASIPLPSRPPKPRERGITMVIDWGIGLQATGDHLAMGAPFYDLAKIAVGISGVVADAFLKEKIALYQRYAVDPFPGGMFLEYAYHHGKATAYLAECVRAGYRTLEVSDNAIHFPAGAKEDLIRRAREDYGLRVLGEVGRKLEASGAAALIRDTERALAAGSWKVFIEGAEFFGEKFRADLVREIAAAVPVEALIFEMPGRWLKDIHASQVHEMIRFLIGELGPDVNLANILPEDLLIAETQRVGVGVGMKL